VDTRLEDLAERLWFRANAIRKSDLPDVYALAFEMVAEEVDELISPSMQSILRLPITGINLEALEKEAIEQALEYTKGNQEKASHLLGISPRVINHKIQVLEITSANRHKKRRSDAGHKRS